MEKKTVKKNSQKEVKKAMKMYYEDGVKEAITVAIDKNFPMLMVGDTGCGKTSFIRDVALSSGKQLIRLNLTGQTGVDEILGKYLVRSQTDKNGNKVPEMYWCDGPLMIAMKKGYWIVFDEINMAAPEILSVLHSLTDDDRFIMLKEKDGEKIIPNDGFRLFATMNPPEEYAGTRELNKAFLSRFSVVLNIEFSEHEALVISERSGIKKDDADMMVLAAREVRKKKEEGELSFTISTRDLISCAELMKMGFNSKQAFEVSILNKTNIEDREKVRAVFELVTGKNIEIETESGTKTYKSLQEVKDDIEKIANRESKIEEDKEMMRKTVSKIKEDTLEFKKVVDARETKFKDMYSDSQSELETLRDNTEKILLKAKVPKNDVEKLIGRKTVTKKKTTTKKRKIEDENAEDVAKREVINLILSHEIYISRLSGIERTDGIFEELAEENIISGDKLEELLGEELYIETVDDVLEAIK